MTKKTSNDYHLAAQARGFSWLGPYPHDVLTKTSWRCNKCGHKWRAAYSSIHHNGTGCPVCAVSRKLAADYEELGNEKSVVWIGTTIPQNTNQPTSWRCLRCGNEFECTYARIRIGTPGCGRCHPGMKVWEDYQNLAEKTFTRLVGNLPRNTAEKTEWECRRCNQIIYESYSQIMLTQGCLDCQIKNLTRAGCWKSVTYFIKMHYTGMVKIGYSSSPQKRLKTLCTQFHGMSLLGMLPGGREMETLLHRRFRHLRPQNRLMLPSDELFIPGDELIVFMRENLIWTPVCDEISELTPGWIIAGKKRPPKSEPSTYYDWREGEVVDFLKQQ